ncbi:hypothetical protein GUJ93_ZPchr0002g25607 [Zizania palustris]|uniref:Uncharacterized protein n=1 Tax=Zizania palustris TaxID=103762 RepID=A0A8J5VUK8_ZIZPA|nr:hypothetical protein GUJ93_ZPchr0002g24092 [Zizania palustris]KAG8060558.1 hypothetical protein GUJ93_ZPchr0002g25607 [Zizania palustris]
MDGCSNLLWCVVHLGGVLGVTDVEDPLHLSRELTVASVKDLMHTVIIALLSKMDRELFPIVVESFGTISIHDCHEKCRLSALLHLGHMSLLITFLHATFMRPMSLFASITTFINGNKLLALFVISSDLRRLGAATAPTVVPVATTIATFLLPWQGFVAT